MRDEGPPPARSCKKRETSLKHKHEPPGSRRTPFPLPTLPGQRLPLCSCVAGLEVGEGAWGAHQSFLGAGPRVPSS